MSPKYSYYEAMRSDPVLTLASATYDASGQLHQTVISGPKSNLLTFPCLPEEGFYVLHGDRGLQLASGACERRGCYISRVCRCDEDEDEQYLSSDKYIYRYRGRDVAAARDFEYEAEYNNNTNLMTGRYGSSGTAAGSGNNAASAIIACRLHLYEAADAIRSLPGMCLLTHARTLS